jgi:NADH:ubiquinone reductase (H+-translocating)
MNKRVSRATGSQQIGDRRRPHVVIVGAGFGGLNAAVTLSRADVDVTVIDRHNYHLFQPLLYQVATAGLSPNQIATPIRQILSRARNTTVLMATVEDVDLNDSAVVTENGRIGFDYLILATGARHAYFGRDDWEKIAPGLKKVDEATNIRKRLLLAFEKAEAMADDAERQRLLSFVVIGSGPTGVEMAGAIAELARHTIAGDFRNINPALAKVYLIEAGPRILPSFPEKLSQSGMAQLIKLGVEVVTGDAVTDMDSSHVKLRSGRVIETATVIWSAGVMASPAAKWLKADADRVGRIKVGADLRLPGRPEIFVIGDTASVIDAKAVAVPGVAPAAKQMGQHVAKTILADIAGRPMQTFTYKNHGNLATVGRKAAVADFGRFQLTGFLAWLVWGLVHVGFLIGFRNRATVMLDWAWSYLTYSRGARLITGQDK